MKPLLIVLSIFLFTSCDQFVDKFFSQKKNVVSLVSEESSTPKSKLKNGVVRFKFPSGKLKSIVHYKDDVKIGTSTTFYETGEKQYEIPYENGKKHGEVKWFYKSGKLYRSTIFVNGIKHGLQKKYWENGKLKSEMLFDNNRMCIGLKEHTNKGKLKATPQIIIKHANHLAENGMYHLEISLDKQYKNAEFFIGELEEGKCFPKRIKPLLSVLDSKRGKAVFKFNIPKGFTVDRDIKVVAKVKSPYLNYYVLTKSTKVSVRNPN